MLVTRACVSDEARSSGMTGSALLTVNGINGLSCVQFPIDRYAVAWLRAGRFSVPAMFPVFRLLLGQSVSRPCRGPSVGESVIRSGLSQTSVVNSFRKNEP